MKLFSLFSKFYKHLTAKPLQKSAVKKPIRRYVKDVKAGEIIQIEWYKFKAGIGPIQCLSNDPEVKKILLEVTWNNYKEMNVPQKEKLILNYYDKELENFNLLNQKKEKPKEVEDDFDIATLQKKINEALEKEEYEKAEELQQKINKILKS